MSFVNRSIFAAYITFVSFYVYAHKEMGVESILCEIVKGVFYVNM